MTSLNAQIYDLLVYNNELYAVVNVQRVLLDLSHFKIFWKSIAENENRCLETCLTKLQSFCDFIHSQPIGATQESRAGGKYHAMPIGV